MFRWLKKKRKIKDEMPEVVGTCPSCDESWNDRKEGMLVYNKKEEVISGLTICTECLKKPENIDVDWVIDRLKRCYWRKKKIELVLRAITNLKEKS